MSAISDFSDRVNTAFDTIQTEVTAIAADVQFLKDTITALQNNPGPISAEDQALLDALETRVNSMKASLEALNASTATPPTP